MTVEQYLAGNHAGAVELFLRFQELAERCGSSEITPRLRIADASRLDAALVCEVYAEVGPGTRRLH